jgi:hypothetical protein
MEKFGSGMEKAGSGINNPDPQHCFFYEKWSNMVLDYRTVMLRNYSKSFKTFAAALLCAHKDLFIKTVFRNIEWLLSFWNSMIFHKVKRFFGKKSFLVHFLRRSSV